MPRPPEWYDNFVKAIQDKVDITAPGSADLFHTFQPPQEGNKPSVNDINYVFDGDDFNPATSISELTDKQKDKLYELCEKGDLVFKAPNANPTDYFIPTNDGAGNFDSVESVEEAKGLPEALRNNGRYRFLDCISEKNNLEMKGLQDACKTLTDMYPGSQLEDFGDTEIIRDGKGDPIPLDRGKRPFEKYTVLLDNLNKQQGVYIQDLDNKKSTQVKIQFDGTVKQTPHESLLIGAKLKENTIMQFMLIEKKLKDVKSENAQFKKMQQDIHETVETLKTTARRDDFVRIVNEFAENADLYFMGKVGAKMNKNGRSCLDISTQVRNIRDAVDKDIVPSEDVKGEYVSTREMLASKYVRTYAATIAKHSENPKMKEYAEKLKTDPEAFKKATEQAMKSDTFNNLFGVDGDPESLKRMQDAYNKDPSDLFKMVQDEVEHPLAERNAERQRQIEHHNLMKAQKPSITDKMQHGPVTEEMTKDVAGLISQIKGGLDKSGYLGKRSPEYKQLDDQLRIAKLRLSRGNKFIDTRALMADVARAAEGYKGKHFGENATRYNMERMMACDKILTGFKAMDNNQLPTSVMQSDTDMKKNLIAQSIIDNSAKMMEQSTNQKVQEMGHKLKIDATVRDDKIKKLMDSEAFKKVVGDDPAQIEKLLKTDPEKVFKKIAEEQAKTDPKAAEKFKKEFGVQEVKEPEKKQVKAEEQVTRLV